ncbi:hypothetical protein AAXB25_15030 [Paenibacillus lautus]|uniref:YfaP family protein n=1 Tax=Paenibacillus lautus TaxID=1401 RepID=UPI003D2B2176
MKQIVMKSRVTGIFLSSERTLGTPTSNGWSHMNVQLPASRVHRDRLKTAGQVMAEKKEDFRILIAGLIEYPLDAVNKAVTLLESESLYRSDRFLGVAKFVQDLHNNRMKAKESRIKDNITWHAVATAPAGFCHVKSSMIGTLLDDIVAGYSTDTITRRFADKMGTYQRSQSAPSTGNIQQAEKIVAQLGIENSLERRYAQIEEVPEFIWKDKGSAKKTEKQSGGVFGNITPKQQSGVQTSDMVELANTVMTWDKFQRTVLPTAQKLEVMVDNPNRFMAMVTANDDTAPNILQWDNTFSWYYHGGIDGEIKRRVESAGGQYENNEIRCSLIWEGYTDLDLHCVTPNGRHIYYGNKREDNGWLDIDMNAGMSNRSATPVENIRWSQGSARSGKYQFYVHNYNERGKGNTAFKVELEVNGKIYIAHGSLRDGQQQVMFTFNYIKGQQPDIRGASVESSESWGAFQNSFVKVNGITNSPNQWGEEKAEHVGHHIFFLLDGVKDESQGKGRGFFTETLKPELREIRKTLEAYTANTPIEGVDDATACGVGYSKDSEWNLVVKVTTDNSTRLIKIDRWD